MASANVNQSNTYLFYPGAIDVDMKYTNRDIQEALKNGEIVFTINNRSIVIEQDINKLKTFSEDKNKYYRKNRVIRTLFEVNNGINLLWNSNYIGKVDNNEDARTLFRKNIIKFSESLQRINVFQNVVTEEVIVEKGSDKDSVVSIVGVQTVDAMEKLYMTIKNEEFTSSIGKQTVVLKNCNFEEVNLASFDVDSDALEEYMEFTFDNANLLDKFKKP